MPIDRFSGGRQDGPDQKRDAGPDGEHPLNVHPTEYPAAETRDRAEYYEALRTSYQETSCLDGGDRATDTQGPSSAWEKIPGADHAGRPAPDRLSFPPERATHILDGDRWGGGHRHGTGRPGKTEFPSDWDDERITGHIVDVARNPDLTPVMQPNHRWRVRGERDGVGITVIVLPDGRIWAAWPEEGGPGVIRNPREGLR